MAPFNAFLLMASAANPGGLKSVLPFPLLKGTFGLALGSAWASLGLETWAVLEDADLWLAEVPLPCAGLRYGWLVQFS